MGYRLNRLDEPVFVTVSKPLLREFGIHRRLESCVYDSFAFAQAWRCDETSGWVEESRMEGHSDWVRDVAWAPSLGGTEGRSVIASCSQDRRVVIWSKESDASTQVLIFFSSHVWPFSHGGHIRK